ncbi:MAG: nucleotide exchange factor GrpE [Bacteroidetes bacterium]|nr:nucleotide exchange factor GrpE [Bacteroidota bacterium]
MQDTDTTQTPPVDENPATEGANQATAPEQDTAPQETAAPAGESAEEWKDRYTRLAAEFDNFRRRTNKEKDDLVQYGNVPLLQLILPVMDDLDRALKAAETAQDIESLRKGLQLVHKNLRAMLDKQGVQMLESLHQPFDSQVHEAIASMPAAEDSLKGKVIEVIEQGYTYRDKVIRYAKVITGE